MPHTKLPEKSTTNKEKYSIKEKRKENSNHNLVQV